MKQKLFILILIILFSACTKTEISSPFSNDLLFPPPPLLNITYGGTAITFNANEIYWYCDTTMHYFISAQGNDYYLLIRLDSSQLSPGTYNLGATGNNGNVSLYNGNNQIGFNGAGSFQITISNFSESELSGSFNGTLVDYYNTQVLTSINGYFNGIVHE